nr:hypothetical protein [Tanacetum cinerariifolium]
MHIPSDVHPIHITLNIHFSELLYTTTQVMQHTIFE